MPLKNIILLTSESESLLNKLNFKYWSFYASYLYIYPSAVFRNSTRTTPDSDKIVRQPFGHYTDQKIVMPEWARTILTIAVDS